MIDQKVQKKASSNKNPKKKTISHFLIDLSKILGSGQFSKVYQAIDLNTKQTIAVKIVQKSSIYSDDYAKNALIRQIQIMQSLQSPNIIKLISVEQSSNNIYIFQQKADCTLNQLMVTSPSKRFDQQTVIEYMAQLLSGMLVLIKNGIMHRDLKPSNILVRDHVIKIADFGLSNYSQYKAQYKTIVGTPAYMAPQLLQPNKNKCRYSYKCDIWSFGIIFYQLLVGTIPWKFDTYSKILDLVQQIRQQSKNKVQFPPNIKISQNTKDLIYGCLKYDQQQRYDWNQIARHPIFKGRFDSTGQGTNLINFENLILTQLRFKIHKENINLEKYLVDMQDSFTLKQFQILFKALNNQLTEKQSQKLFGIFQCKEKQLENNQMQTISKENILKKLQQHGIKLKGVKGKIFQTKTNNKQSQITAKVQKLIKQKIIKNINSKSIQLYKLLNITQKNQRGQIQKKQFIQFLKCINGQISQEEIMMIFQYFNPEEKSGVDVGYFYESLCKIGQIPILENEEIQRLIGMLKR